MRKKEDRWQSLVIAMLDVTHACVKSVLVLARTLLCHVLKPILAVYIKYRQQKAPNSPSKWSAFVMFPILNDLTIVSSETSINHQNERNNLQISVTLNLSQVPTDASSYLTWNANP